MLYFDRENPIKKKSDDCVDRGENDFLQMSNTVSRAQLEGLAFAGNTDNFIYITAKKLDERSTMQVGNQMWCGRFWKDSSYCFYFLSINARSTTASEDERGSIRGLI